MKKQAKRFTSLLCVLALCMTLLPVSALAAEGEPVDGTQQDPVESTMPEFSEDSFEEPSEEPSEETEPTESLVPAEEPEPTDSPDQENDLATQADGDVAQVGDITYTTLDEAVEEATEGSTIVLLQDCELTKGFNKTLTFTGGHKITINKQLTSNGEGWMCFGLYDPTRVLTFDGVEVEWNSEVGTAPWLMLSLSGTLNVTNGAKVKFTVDSGSTGSRNAIYMNAGSSINVSNGSTFEIHGYETEGKEGQGLQLDKTGKATVNVTKNSTFLIDGTNRGYVNSPTINVEDSTFTVQNCTANASNGGKFTATNSTVTYANNAGHGLSAGEVTLVNSKFTADNNGYYGVYASSAFFVDSKSKLIVTHNSDGGDFAGLKLTSGVTDGLVESGAEVTITDNYCSGLSNNGKLVFEEGAKLTITGNFNDKGTSSHGGGIYNSGAAANLTLPSNAVIYNNHSKTDGDDIFNNTTATITFGEVGSDWTLDGDPDCTDAIDGWYDDSEGNRWEAHDAPYHAVEFTEFETLTGMTTVTGLKALKAAHGLTPLEPGEETGDWELSKSKTATNLDSNYESEVTLSLPAADYEPTIDVVFVIDDTSAGSSIFEVAVNSLLDELVAKENLDVNVGVIAFDAVARDWLDATNDTYSGLVSLKDSSALTALKTAIGTELSPSNEGYTRKIGASNTEWPMELAQEMLAKGNGTEQHVIVFSDMYGYVYRGVLDVGNTSYSGVPLSKRLAGYDLGQLCISPPMFDTWEEVYAGYDEDDRTLDTFFRDTSWDDYWTIYKKVNPAPDITEAHQNSAPQYNPDLTPYVYFTPFEKSSCLTYDRILKLLNGDIQVTIVNNNFNPGANGDVIQGIKNGMLDALESQGVLVIQEDTPNGGEFTSNQMRTIFSKLENKLVQLVDAGSSVVDVIGSGTDNDGNDYNFDFVIDIDNLKLTVGGKELDKDLLIDAQASDHYVTSAYVFGGHEDGSYDFVLKYYANGQDGKSDECFIWEINVPVTKDAPVQLTYTVKLMNPQTAEGTYGEYDADGLDENDNPLPDAGRGLFTNNSATLYPVDSNGQPGRPENFAKPTVSYTVEDDDDDDYNPPHRPSNPDKDDDEDDEPEDLNTEDHVAYIIGYTDGTVRPQGNIARSEVATIFFRLLTDEARETYWSQTNPYSDVAPDAWYNNAISTLTNMGILDGYLDGTFRPTAPITRSEFTKIAVSFFDYADEHFVYDGRFSDVEGNEWYVNFLAAAIEYGLIEGMPDGTFHPLDNITRAEACTIVNRTLGRAPHEDHLLPWREMITWPDNSNTDAWYYAAMQEATNSHDYAWTVEDREDVEEWTEKLEERDWAALERTWSDAHDAPGGEVMD